MTDLEKQMADALRKAYEALMLSRPGSENNEPTEEEWQAHFAARRTARDALAKFDAQAAEQAAGGASFTTTGDTNGRHDGLRRALHGGLALGGYTTGALADRLFASPDVMALNAELDLTMDQLVRLAQALSKAAEQAAGGGEAVAWRPKLKDRPKHLPESDFTAGKPSAQTLEYWSRQGVEIEYAYTHPAPAAPVQPVGERVIDELSPDDIFRLADEQAEDSLENGNRVFDRSGLIQFARDIEARAALSARPEPSDAAAPTYSSTQATNCASCGEHKHTPLRIDAMGGYVCLTCIDKKLGGMLGEFGYEPDAEIDALRWRGLEWTQQADSHGPIFVAVVRRNLDGSPWAVDAAIDAALAARGEKR